MEGQQTEPIKVLLAAKPGYMQESIRSILMSCPQILLTGMVVDEEGFVQSMENRLPHVVIIKDDFMLEGLAHLTKLLVERYPEVRSVFITRRPHEEAGELQGFTEVLPVKFKSSELLQTVVAVVSR